MKTFKKHVSLHLVFILVFSLFMPFVGAVPVYAVQSDPLGTGTGTARGGDLRTSVNATMTLGTANVPSFNPGASAPAGSIMLNWPVSTPVGGRPFMDVLRFFDEFGHRHELSVRRIEAADGPGLMVNYDVFIPRRNSTTGLVESYIHVSDPLRGSVSPPNFRIWTSGPNRFLDADEFFAWGNGWNYPIVDVYPHTSLNRANDRMRFQYTRGEVASGIFVGDAATYNTPLHPDYPRNVNSRTILFGNHMVTIPNPDYPADPPVPPTIDVQEPLPPVPVFGENDAAVRRDHYMWLSPSFNIGDGHGYSFEFFGRRLHFLWENGEFLFFIENIISNGSIHDFRLERYGDNALYSETQNNQVIDNYIRGTSTAMLTSQNTVAHTVRGEVYVFANIDRYTTSIPFANNAGAPGIPLLPHTNPRFLLGGRYEQLTTPTPPALAFATHLVGDHPRFDITDIDMRDDPPRFLPSMPDIGIDIRFNLPSFFREEHGMFSDHITSRPVGRQLNVVLQTRVNVAINTPEDFEVRFPLYGMPAFGGTAAAGWDYLMEVRERPEERPHQIEIRDISLLERVNNDFPAHRLNDRVRIAVGGLSPSIAYEFASLTIAPILDGETSLAPNFLNVSAGGISVASPAQPFYTFLNFRFEPRLGSIAVIAEPFNFSVARLGRGIPIREGYYTLETDNPYVGAIPVQVGAGATNVYFSLPDLVELPWRFFISHTLTAPIVEGQPRPFELLSQNVIWRPNREPGLDMPGAFAIDNTRVRHRPMREPDFNFDIYQAGYLDFNVQWTIGPISQILERLGHPQRVGYEPGNQFGSPTDIIWARYTIGHATAPEVEPMEVGAESVHRPYLHVDFQIRRTQRPDGTFYNDRVDMRVMPSSNFADPPIYIAPDGGRSTPHPLQENIDEGWRTVIPRTDPAVRDQVVYADINIFTNTARRHRYPPPPQHMRNEFEFPDVYFMNVMLNSWGIIPNGLEDQNAIHGPNIGASPWSTFDYIVVDDFGELDPPPPANLEVAAGPADGIGTQPYLNVRYNIPGSAIVAYLNTLTPLRTQVTANLYVGQFYDALMDTFFPVTPGMPDIRTPLAPESRGLAENARSIPFEDLFMGFEGNRAELDLSDPSIQRMLRGDLQAGDPTSAVLRITDIPIITTSPPALNVILNYGVAGSPYQLEESLELTYAALNRPSDIPILLRLVGMEENTPFFLFADLEIVKYVDDDYGNWEFYEVGANNPAISDLTGIVTDTTAGTPDQPGLGEVGPAAPQNLHIYEFDQMSAAVRWDPHTLTPAEQEDPDRDIRIEWEIIRIQDGQRLTDDQMSNRDSNFAAVFASIVTNPGYSRGWITDGDNITALPDNEVFTREPDDPYAYDRLIVELRDRTLRPNSLYFYYVRTVRIERAFDEQLGTEVMVRSVSVWTEVTVTTHPILPPINLRQEDPTGRPGFDEQTMSAVSWEHAIMEQILEGRGETFRFLYQIREAGEPWGAEETVMPIDQMTAAFLDASNRNRIHYLVTGLNHSTVYEMRVRLYDVTAGDRSLWSNTITFMTGIDQGMVDRDREIDDWLNYLRRRLEEILRQPFWTVQRTATSNTLVYRPAGVFTGFMESVPGTALPLHTIGAANTVFYLPTSIVFTANEYRRGFSTAFDDMEFMLAPSFLSTVDNQPVMDMMRALDARGTVLSDSFVRMEINRSSLSQINNVPAITTSNTLSMEMVATNNSIRNINTWDQHMLNSAERIVERWLADPVIRQGILDQLLADMSNEEISDHIYHVVNRVEAEIIVETARSITTAQGGILSTERRPIHDFDAAMHVVARGVTDDMFVSGYRETNNHWQQQNLVEHHNGRAFVTRAPGRFAFTGRVVDIPGITEVPRGGVVTGIVARYGLEDLFGLNVDLQQNANRQMVVGSIARMAGVPQGADPFAWANANLNVTMSGRNATGLISRQEAIAVTMALYEHRTGTGVNTIMVRNFQNIAGMSLDARYAQAVRAAFEMGIISDTSMNPSGAISIGEFLDMLSIMSARVRV